MNARIAPRLPGHENHKPGNDLRAHQFARRHRARARVKLPRGAGGELAGACVTASSSTAVRGGLRSLAIWLSTKEIPRR